MPEGGGSDPLAWLKSFAESATRVRLAPGVIGKSAYINIGIVAAWAIVIFRLSENPYLDVGLVACALAVTIWGRSECQKMRQYAIDNPHLALMEGADITEYRKFEEEAKGYGRITPGPLISDPLKPLSQKSSLPVIDAPDEK